MGILGGMGVMGRNFVDRWALGGGHRSSVNTVLP